MYPIDSNVIQPNHYLAKYLKYQLQLSGMTQVLADNLMPTIPRNHFRQIANSSKRWYLYLAILRITYLFERNADTKSTRVD